MVLYFGLRLREPQSARSVLDIGDLRIKAFSIGDLRIKAFSIGDLRIEAFSIGDLRIEALEIRYWISTKKPPT
jgi:hypothetical protein